MKFLVMTAPTFFVEEDKILAELFASGMEYLHLLKPHASRTLLERLLKLLPQEVLEATIIHGNSTLKDTYQLAGVNLDSNTPSPSWWKRGKVTRTCKSIDQLAAARKQADWVLLDGVFGRTANPDLPPLSHAEIERASEQGLLGKRVYALGDITPDNIRAVRDYGFGGAVLSMSLWQSFDIHSDADFKGPIDFFERCRGAV